VDYIDYLHSATLECDSKSFRVKKFAEYGKLSKRPLEDLESGSRIEADSSKEDPLDFAL
jgi:cysteinyl-tRNA synthetase